MHLFSADTTTFLKTFKFFFCSQKVEKPTLKSCSENSNPLFFLTASTAQKAQAEEVMFQNVAYRPKLYIELGFALTWFH